MSKPKDIQKAISAKIGELLISKNFMGRVVNDDLYNTIRNEVRKVLAEPCGDLSKVKVRVICETDGTVRVAPENLFTGLLMVVWAGKVTYDQIIPFVNDSECVIDGIGYRVTDKGLNIILKAGE